MKTLQGAGTVRGDERVNRVWVIGTDAKGDPPRVGGKASPRSRPSLADVVGMKNAGGCRRRILSPLRAYKSCRGGRRGNDDAGEDARALLPPFKSAAGARDTTVETVAGRRNDTVSRARGSTANAKNASPARSGVLVSLTQVTPPSSLRKGPTPRYAGSALTIRARNSCDVSPSPVPTYKRFGSFGSIAIAPQITLALAKVVGSVSKRSIIARQVVPPSAERKTPPLAEAA